MGKKFLALFCTLILLAALTACDINSPTDNESSAPADSTPVADSSAEETPAQPSEAAPEAVQTPEDTQEPEEIPAETNNSTPETDAVETDARMQAYADLLTDLMENGVLPDHDTKVLYDEVDSDVTFALEDFNGDGQTELLVTISTVVTAGNLLEVYDYQDGELIREMSEFPMVSFFNNGTATAEWAHNQTMSEFWPFTIYVYNADSGTFDPAGSVYAVDEETAEDSFPAGVDADGNGRVYYISSADGSGVTDTVDDAAMNDWYSSYIGTADQIVPEEYTLTPENLAAIFGNA